jgi:hypothetical protein
VRKSKVRMNALARPLNVTCPSSSRSCTYTATQCVEDRVEPVAVRTIQVQLHVDLFQGMDLAAVQLVFQRMKLVGIRGAAENGGAVIIGERLLDGVDVVVKGEYEHGVFVGVGAFEQAGQHRLLAHIHEQAQDGVGRVWIEPSRRPSAQSASDSRVCRQLSIRTDGCGGNGGG